MTNPWQPLRYTRQPLDILSDKTQKQTNNNTKIHIKSNQTKPNTIYSPIYKARKAQNIKKKNTTKPTDP